MKQFLYSSGMILMSLHTVAAHAIENNVEKFGVYVVVSDIDRSREFYEKLFQKQPYVKNDRFVGFDVAGGLYAIFAEHAADGKLLRGNNAVPYIRVKDADREFERVAALTSQLIGKKVTQEGPIKFFRLTDPDGNVIEFFSLATMR